MWDLSSLTRDGTHVPCLGGRILYHWTTREVPDFLLRDFSGFCAKNGLYRTRVEVETMWEATSVIQVVQTGVGVAAAEVLRNVRFWI